MTIVYAVNSGEYSDYHIDAIFTTREIAEKYMQTFKKEGYGGYNDIEEWELDRWMTEIDQGLTHYRVIMYRSGNVHSVVISEYPDHSNGKVNWMDRAYWNPSEPWANFYVWARDKEHAVKIANERRIQALAQG
jgi:hypothetical protein